MEKSSLTHEEWLALWHSALALATCEAIPEDILNDYTRHRLTGFLCEKSFEAGRRKKKKHPKGRVLKRSTDVIQ